MYDAGGCRQAEPRPGSEEDALEVVASMMARVRESGVLPLQKMSLGEKMAQAAALSLLAQPPTSRMLAEALTHEVFRAFVPTLQRFQAELQAAGPDIRLAPLLQRLYESYSVSYGVLAEWCRQLGVAEAAAELHVRLRCALLQPDLLTHEAPPGRTELLRLLRQHAKAWLEQREEGGEEAADEATGVAASQRPSRGRSGSGRKSNTARDGDGGKDDVVMQCLHGLTLSRTRELRQLWQGVLEGCIEARVSAQADEEEDFAVHTLPACLAWQESVVNHFVHMALPMPKSRSSLLDLPQCAATRQSCRSEGTQEEEEKSWLPAALPAARAALEDGVGATRAARAEWCAQLRQKLLTSYARRRLAVFWDLLVEYPDSTPVLEDVQYCLQACPDDTLRNELIHTVRHLLAARLHRAGTRTEDILSVLSKTIHSLCVLLPRSEQSSVTFSVVSDTLDHLRRRKDCVSTIVKAITQPKSDVSLFDGSTPFAAAEDADREEGGGGSAAEHALGDDDDDDDDDDDERRTRRAQDDTIGDEEAVHLPASRTTKHRTSSSAASGRSWRRAGHAKPDVLRVLLTAIRVKVLAQEYQQVLAEQLLAKPMHNFDVTAEEEVLERLKCVFGEEALTGCVIMLHDIEHSRRITTQLRDMLKSPPPSAGATRHRDTDESDEAEDEDEEEDEDDEPRVMAGRASVCLPARRSPFLTHTPPPPPPQQQQQVQQQVQQQSVPAPSPLPPALPAEALSLHVLSMTAWPRLAQLAGGVPPLPAHFAVHPALQGEMDRIGRVYRELKVNRKLVWLCAQGHVELELMQRRAQPQRSRAQQHNNNNNNDNEEEEDAEGRAAHSEGNEAMAKEAQDADVQPVTYTLSLFAASIVLFVKDLEAAAAAARDERGAPAVTVAAVAARMQIAESALQPHLAALMPAVLTYDKAGGLRLQTRAVSSSAQFVFDEAATDEAQRDGAGGSDGGAAAEAHAGASAPAGLSPEQLKMLQLMIAAMLKAGGPKSVAEIHNSMKIFGQFTGTVAEMRRLLLQLVSSGTLVMDGAKQLFSLPPH